MLEGRCQRLRWSSLLRCEECRQICAPETVTDGPEATPAELETTTDPPVAPAGTMTLTWVGAALVIVAGTPPMVTPVTSDRFSPLIVSFLPGLADAGLTLVTSGVSPPTWYRGSPAGSDVRHPDVGAVRRHGVGKTAHGDGPDNPPMEAMISVTLPPALATQTWVPSDD